MIRYVKDKKINYDNHYSYGCETCDYGSSYVSNIEILFEDETILKIETEQMYEYTLTESDFMNLLSSSKDLNEFYKNMFETIKHKSYNIEMRESLTNMVMKINDKKIDIANSCKTYNLVEKVEQ